MNTHAPKTRREQAEKQGEKWAEEMCPSDPHAPVGEQVPIRQVWLYRGYQKGWADADSTPAPSEHGDEEFIHKMRCELYDDLGIESEVKAALEKTIQYARRTQNAEVERLKNDVKRYSEMSLQYMSQIQELRSLLEKFKEMTEHALTLGHLGEGSTKGWAQECLGEYEKLRRKKES